MGPWLVEAQVESAVPGSADGLRHAGWREGDQIGIVVGPHGRLRLQPLLQPAMPLTPSVMQDCRAHER